MPLSCGKASQQLVGRLQIPCSSTINTTQFYRVHKTVYELKLRHIQFKCLIFIFAVASATSIGFNFSFWGFGWGRGRLCVSPLAGQPKLIFPHILKLLFLIVLINNLCSHVKNCGKMESNPEPLIQEPTLQTARSPPKPTNSVIYF